MKNKMSVLIIDEKVLFIFISLIVNIDVAEVSLSLTALRCSGIFFSSYLCKCDLFSDKRIHILHKLLINCFREPALLHKSSSDSLSLKHAFVYSYIITTCDELQAEVPVTRN